MSDNYSGCPPLLHALQSALEPWNGREAIETRDLDWERMMEHLFQGWTPTPRRPDKQTSLAPSYTWLQKALSELSQHTTPARSSRGDSRSTVGAWLLDCAWTELSVRRLTTNPCRDDVQYRVTPNDLFVALTTYYTDPENKPAGKPAKLGDEWGTAATILLSCCDWQNIRVLLEHILYIDANVQWKKPTSRSQSTAPTPPTQFDQCQEPPKPRQQSPFQFQPPEPISHTDKRPHSTQPSISTHHPIPLQRHKLHHSND